jgi:oxepin-CoA hydrolase / 3-oxo-5,6-dehydrosuberyl-CoA semialdehyde dehydrogenase
MEAALSRGSREPGTGANFGPVLANYGIDNLRFLTPLKPSDAVTVSLTCKQISPRPGDYREVAGRQRSPTRTTPSWPATDVLTMVAKTWNM